MCQHNQLPHTVTERDSVQLETGSPEETEGGGRRHSIGGCENQISQVMSQDFIYTKHDIMPASTMYLS